MVLHLANNKEKINLLKNLWLSLLKFLNIFFSVVYNASIVWWIKIFNQSLLDYFAFH